ncbi:hypothetical protein [Allomeiothermus silvanus]|uniref:hypothetical protein n=1 Tax=Allomeiothermus silvanus TaxID=52022 RepID=UPI0023F3B9D0|nr:hypothetical protein [Allomeiothermus silvanus]
MPKRTLLVLTALGLSLGPALALQPVLTTEEIQRALKEGSAMNTPRNGYILGDYLLKEYNDGISLKPGDGEVDAIIVATPYERVRYFGYLESIQRKLVTETALNAVVERYKNKLTFVIFTHSPYTVDQEVEQWTKAYGSSKITDEEGKTRQRSYLDQYQEATLEVGGKTYTAKPSVDGPYTDIFSIQGSRPQSRFLGLISYSFDLSDLAANAKISEVGKFSFKDSQGQTTYSETVDLGKYF